MTRPGPDGAAVPAATHDAEQHRGGLASRLNWLRAGVLGANDGIVSTAGLVVGVAGATGERGPVLVAGLAGLVAGALSMAGGEYVSVSSQRDTELAALSRERWELRELPADELDELAGLYRAKGLGPELARQVAVALSEHDALAAHAEAELGLDPRHRVDPWRAAWASMAAFTVGALLPLLAIVLPGASWRVPVTMVAVTLALALTGAVGATLGSAHRAPAVRRNVVVGLLTMAITFGTGALVGALT